MSLPFVSVIIPHLNDHERLVRCLERLEAQSYPRDLFEIIVVDNGSDRPLGEAIGRFPAVRGHFEAERGCGTARNAGVAISRGEVLAFTDSDCLPHPDWLLAAVRCLTGPDRPDIVGGDIKVFAADEADPTSVELYDMVFGFEQRRYVRWKKFAAGANIITTRVNFDRIGPFKNGKLPEDLEWGQRASAMGLSIVYDRKAVIHHPARRTWQQLIWKMDRTIYHQRNDFMERGQFLARWLFFVLLLSVPPVDKLWLVMTSSRISGAGPRFRVIPVLLRLRAYRVRRMVDCLLEGPDFGREYFNA